MKKIGLIGLVGAASLAAAANAGFTGWQASVRASGSNTIVDVFAGFNTAGDKLLNVFNMNIGLTGGAAFVQAAGVAASKWKPVDDTSNNVLADSFVTLGGFDGGDGTMYTSYSTSGDPNFTNYTTANATTIPANAGWYNGVPTTTDIQGITIFGGAFSAWTVASKDAASASGSLGVWMGHFLVNKLSTDTSWTFTINGSAAFNTGTNAADTKTFHNAPAPGALALLGVAGLASRRRRA
jgi:hypothetical protein